MEVLPVAGAFVDDAGMLAAGVGDCAQTQVEINRRQNKFRANLIVVLPNEF
jgi:hypothetical protein